MDNEKCYLYKCEIAPEYAYFYKGEVFCCKDHAYLWDYGTENPEESEMEMNDTEIKALAESIAYDDHTDSEEYIDMSYEDKARKLAEAYLRLEERQCNEN